MVSKKLSRQASRPQAVMLAFALAATCATSPASASPIADANADFSVTNGNPNGVWSYGYESSFGSGPVTLFTNADSATFADPGLLSWQQGGTNGDQYLGVYKNQAGIIGSDFQNGDMGLFPGANGEAAVVGYTSAIGGVFDFTYQFDRIDAGFTEAGAQLGANLLVDDFLDVSNMTVSGGFTQALLPGSTLYFLLGPNGGTGDNLVRFNATVSTHQTTTSQIPEPGTLNLMIAGLAGAWSLRRRGAAKSTLTEI